MIPIFVISLKESDLRRQKMTEKLDALGLDFSFIDAVDGRSKDIHDQESYAGLKRLLYFGKHLDGGEWGCLESHKKIYEKIIKEDIEQAIILEDDAVLNENFPDTLEFLDNNSERFDIIRFFGSPKIQKTKQRRLFHFFDEVWLSRLPSIHGGAHAYAITHRGATKMLRFFKNNKVAYPIDTLIGRCWETGIISYAIHPLATQDLSLDSAIGDERFNKRKDLTGFYKLIFPFTRAWYKLTEAIGKNYIYWSNLKTDMYFKKK